MNVIFTQYFLEQYFFLLILSSLFCYLRMRSMSRSLLSWVLKFSPLTQVKHNMNSTWWKISFCRKTEKIKMKQYEKPQIICRHRIPKIELERERKSFSKIDFDVRHNRRHVCDVQKYNFLLLFFLAFSYVRKPIGVENSVTFLFFFCGFVTYLFMAFHTNIYIFFLASGFVASVAIFA